MDGRTGGVSLLSLYPRGSEEYRRTAETVGGSYTLALHWAANPRVVATASLTNNDIYLHAPAFNLKTLDGMAATLLHEVLHNMGYLDRQIQDKLGLQLSSDDTSNITAAIEKDCIGK